MNAFKVQYYIQFNLKNTLKCIEKVLNHLRVIFKVYECAIYTFHLHKESHMKFT